MNIFTIIKGLYCAHPSMRVVVKHLIVTMVFLLSTSAHSAASERVSIGELIDFIKSQGKNSLENYAASELMDSLEATEFDIVAGELVDVVKYPDSNNHKVRSICHRFKTTDTESRVRVDRSSNLRLEASQIDKPIKFKAEVDVTVAIEGRLHVEVGLPVLGFCNWGASVKFSKTFRASVKGSADLLAVLEINPTRQTRSNGQVRYKIEPTLKTSGKVTDIGLLRTQVIHGGVVGAVLNDLDDLIFHIADNFVWDISFFSHLAESAADGMLRDRIKEREKEYTKKMAKLVLGDAYSSWSYGQPIIKYYDMPEYASLALEDAIEFISEGISNYEHRFPVSYEFLQQDNIREALYTALIEGDSETLTTLLGSSLACEFALDQARPLKIQSTSVYVDTQSDAEYCNSKIGENSRNLGNASDVTKSAWILHPGTTLDVGVKSIQDNYQPYMQRVRYKTVRAQVSGKVKQGQECYYDDQGYIQYCSDRYVNTYYGDGYCELEMRVYKKNPTATGLKPLMAIHGGSWRYRGFGFSGLESMISHFTDRGYAVFAPFYRLVGESDGNVECNNVSGKEIVADIKSALTWVRNNTSSYGASGKVKLFGQSAGAHLSAYLSVHQKNYIDRAWLMYPPTDIGDYIAGLSDDDNENKIGAIRGLLSYRNFDSIDALRQYSDSFVLANSFPNIIDNSPNSYPPTFIMHGVQDDLVPVRQAKRLCTAYGGNNNYSATNTGGYRGINNCGTNDSKLHLFQQASHIMDLGCIDRDYAGGQLCPAGSYQSEKAIEASFNEGLSWLGNTSTGGNSGSSSSGGSSGPTVYFRASCSGQGCQGPGTRCAYEYNGNFVNVGGNNFECRSQ